KATGFTGAAKKQALLPGDEGRIAGVALGTGSGDSGEPCGPSALLAGQLAASLPEGSYHLAGGAADAETAAIAWGLGAYRFQRYKDNSGKGCAALRLPAAADRRKIEAVVEAIWLGRDLINTPASDLGPAELEDAARRLGERHGATVRSVVGEALL